MQRGFTLIEILVAMAIFTLIGLASTGLLTTVIDSNDLSAQRFEKLQQLQRAMITIERDILQAVPRSVRLEGQKNQIVMAGGRQEDSDGDSLGFVRAGWQNPQMMLPRSTLQFVSYRLKDEKLERLYGNYVDNVIGFEPKIRVLMDDVTELTVEFIAQKSSGATSNRMDDEEQWSESYTGQVLPYAVAIEFNTKDFGLIRREFTLTGGA